MAIKYIESPLSEITLRRYEKPYDLDRRGLVQKVCLSLGLLQPGDSRDVMVDVLYVLLEARQRKVLLSSIEVRNRVVELRSLWQLPMVGVADSNIRRQLLRLRDVFIVEKVKSSYRITEHEHLIHIIEQKIESYLLPSILHRIKEYLQAVDTEFSGIES